MKSLLHKAIRTRRKALWLTQAEVARRSGIQQRQVSVLERGGEVTISTLRVIAQALDAELLLIPKQEVPRVEALLQRPQEAIPTPSTSSLLDRYQVRDAPESPDG